MLEDEKHDDEDFFQLLRHYHRQGAVLCCGGVKEAGQKQGLVPKHAFSLLQVRAVPLNWHSNEYFRMVPWQLCVSRTCGTIARLRVLGIAFCQLCFKSAMMRTDKWKFRFDLAFTDLYGSLWWWSCRYQVTEPHWAIPCSLSRCRYEILGELESGRDLGVTGHHSGMLGLCWRPRLDSAWLGLTRLDYRSHTEISKRFDISVNVCQEFSMIRYFLNNSRRTPPFKKWQE